MDSPTFYEMGSAVNSNLLCPAHGERAVAALRKALRLHAKRVVEPCPVIFPRQRRRQFHQLRVAELLPQLRKQRLWNLDGSLRHGVGIFQHQPLRLRKQRVVLVVGQCF